MGTKPFKFKQFTIKQDQCAMKIGTDGVLLGAWAPIEHLPNSILDIGTGTGIIALQLAQRSDAETIDALEIDDNAYEQAVENFENSDWSNRLFCYHASLQELTLEIEDTYDLIVSNPPFYTDAFEPENKKRSNARFTSSLPFEELINSVSKLLSRNGVFSIVLPFKEEENFLHLAKKATLHATDICRVKGTTTSAIKRSLIAFSFEKSQTKLSELVIETERHKYTQEYRDIVQDFYLKM